MRDFVSLSAPSHNQCLVFKQVFGKDAWPCDGRPTWSSSTPILCDSGGPGDPTFWGPYPGDRPAGWSCLLYEGGNPATFQSRDCLKSFGSLWGILPSVSDASATRSMCSSTEHWRWASTVCCTSGAQVKDQVPMSRTLA
jgi:hypothetical protein